MLFFNVGLVTLEGGDGETGDAGPGQCVGKVDQGTFLERGVYPGFGDGAVEVERCHSRNFFKFDFFRGEVHILYRAFRHCFYFIAYEVYGS